MNAIMNAPPWMQRLVTIVTGVGVAVVGAKVAGLSGLVPTGFIVIGWAIPHVADRARGGEGAPPAPPGPPAAAT